MIKLKIGSIPDDKPVKLAVELPAGVHRDLLAYANSRSGRWPSRQRSGQTDCADAGEVHGH